MTTDSPLEKPRGRTPADALPDALSRYLPRHRWFAGKARTITSVTVTDRVPLPPSSGPLAPSSGERARVRGPEHSVTLPLQIELVLCNVDFASGPSETYLLPISVATGDEAHIVRRDWAEFVIHDDSDRVIYDATPREELWRAVLDLIGKATTLSGQRGTITAAFTSAPGSLGETAEPGSFQRHTQQQSHSSAHFGDRLMLKLFRKLAEGINPDLEIGRFFGGLKMRVPAPALAGWMEYRTHDGRQMALAMLQEFVPNEGDAWTFTLGRLGEYSRRVESQTLNKIPSAALADILRLSATETEPSVAELLGNSLRTATLLGQRTGEMHVALASDATNPDFVPKSFRPEDLTELQLSMRSTVTRTFALLKQRSASLPSELQPMAADVAQLETPLLARLEALPQRRFASRRIRVHGDYHLGQVLWTGSDFVIIDFEGEPDRPIAERRVKQSPLKDIAGMLRSLHYASHAGLMGLIPGVTNTEALRPWLQTWYVHSAAAFLRGYRQAAADLLPADPQELAELLELFVLDKLVYELAYELNSRPDWARIPFTAMKDIAVPAPSASEGGNEMFNV